MDKEKVEPIPQPSKSNEDESENPSSSSEEEDESESGGDDSGMEESEEAEPEDESEEDRCRAKIDKLQELIKDDPHEEGYHTALASANKLLEELSQSSHLRTKLLLRFLTFIRSCRDSKKKCLSTLVNRACNDEGSITKQNLNFIEAESGRHNVLLLNNATVESNLKYVIPEGEEWRICFFNELVQLSMNNYELDSQFTNAELGAILEYVCTT